MWFVEKYKWLYGQDPQRGIQTFEAQCDQPKNVADFVAVLQVLQSRHEESRPICCLSE